MIFVLLYFLQFIRITSLFFRFVRTHIREISNYPVNFVIIPYILYTDSHIYAGSQMCLGWFSRRTLLGSSVSKRKFISDYGWGTLFILKCILCYWKIYNTVELLIILWQYYSKVSFNFKSHVHHNCKVCSILTKLLILKVE